MGDRNLFGRISDVASGIGRGIDTARSSEIVRILSRLNPENAAAQDRAAAQKAASEQDFRQRLEFAQKMHTFKTDAEDAVLKRQAKETAEGDLKFADILERAGLPDADIEALEQETAGISGRFTKRLQDETFTDLGELKQRREQQAGIQQVEDIIKKHEIAFPPGTEPSRREIGQVRAQIANIEGAPEAVDEGLRLIAFPPTDAKFKEQERVRKAAERDEAKRLKAEERTRKVVERKETSARKTISDVTSLLRKTSKGTLVLQTFQAFQAGENLDSGTVLNSIEAELNKTEAGRRMKPKWREAFNTLFPRVEDDIDSIVSDFEEQERRAKAK